MHACNSILKNLDIMQDSDESVTGQSSQTQHKEESKACIKIDSVDCQGIKQKLDACIDPLNEYQDTDKLVNIVTGQVISDPSVTIDSTIQIGRTQMEQFENG